MIIGAHTVLYSRNAEADRAFLRDVLQFAHVDAGHGWLIFGLPPAEIAVHPSDAHSSEEQDAQEFYLMCDDIHAFVEEMQRHGVACGEPSDQRWGILTHITLPGGGKLGVYQPKHTRPAQG